MDYEVDICQLSQAFFTAYPPNQFPELMTKDARPYTCLLIETHEDYLICVPFRSSIQHKEAFLFTNTQRSKRTQSGLDYKKAVIIKDGTYIDSTANVVVDNDEYTAMMTNIGSIVENVHKYVQKYVDHVLGTKVLHPREYLRRFQYSTLPYFHPELGLESSNESKQKPE